MDVNDVPIYSLTQLAGMSLKQTELKKVKADVYDLPCEWHEMLDDVIDELKQGTANRFEITYDGTCAVYTVNYYIET